jgi:D-lyxose ketol-isomerase
MKRSQINNILRSADAFARERQFFLPPWAYWKPDEWRTKGPEVGEIVRKRLGWDITDFGSGDFAKIGLFLFTIRNGDLASLQRGEGKVYAEKLLIVDVDQVTPFHFHWVKTEDIINRGGGKLNIRLYNATPDGGFAGTPITVSTDGIVRTVPAGGVVTLSPGESITLLPYCYHEFWGSEGKVLVGEVSTVNDDSADNRFYTPAGRFPQIDEDEEPLYLLVGDYDRYYGVPAASRAAT